MSDKPPEKEPPAKPRRRGCLAKLGLVFGSFVFSLLLAELIVNLFSDEVLPNPIGPRNMFEIDPVMGIDLTPNFVGRFKGQEFDTAIRINSRGFRDREFGDKTAGTTRIICIGDSFAFGYGVEAEEAYPSVLQRELNTDPGQRVFEVLNGGAPGRGILHMRRVLEKCKDWFQPDLVIASFFYVNDLVGIDLFPEHTVRGGIVLTRHFGKAVDESAWLRFSVNYSKLSLLAFRGYYNLLEKNRGSSFRLGDQPVQAANMSWGVGAFRISADPSVPDEARELAKRDQLLDAFEEQLAKFRSETEALGAKLILLTIPQEPQTVDAVWQHMVEKGHVPKERYDRDLVGKQLAAICERTGVSFFDLVPVFRANPKPQTRFFPVNRHFNETGHEDAAKYLADYLRKHGHL